MDIGDFSVHNYTQEQNSSLYFFGIQFFFSSPADTCKGIIYYSSLCSLSCYCTCVFKQLVNLFTIINFEMLFLLILYREHAPSIIFMDEIDSIGSSRLEGGSGGKIWLFVCLFLFIYQMLSLGYYLHQQ